MSMHVSTAFGKNVLCPGKMSDEKIQRFTDQILQAPRPSSPRKFFARIYGHLEEKTSESPSVESQECESSSDVEIGENEPVVEGVGTVPVWAPPPLPVYPRPMLLPHQQLAFGAGLAAFCKFIFFYLVSYVSGVYTYL
jgi:hypothetical protein